MDNGLLSHLFSRRWLNTCKVQSSHRSSMLLLIVGCLSLTGCPIRSTANEPMLVKTNAVSDIRIIDFSTVDCSFIWLNEQPEVLNNPLFWLRAVDCSTSLIRAKARKLAEQQVVVSWHSALKQSLLLADTELSIVERRRLLETFNKYRQDMPISLRPLLQIWREQQINLLTLQEERKRYQQLLIKTDNRIDALKAKERDLQHQLDQTSRKLSSLTNIEHQLSSRKDLSHQPPDEQENRALKTVPVQPDNTEPTAESKKSAPQEERPVDLTQPEAESPK